MRGDCREKTAGALYCIYFERNVRVLTTYQTGGRTPPPNKNHSRVLQPQCSRTDGVTGRGTLVRHNKNIHEYSNRDARVLTTYNVADKATWANRNTPISIQHASFSRQEQHDSRTRSRS